MASDFESAATELLALAGSENTSGAIVAAVLEEHASCFDSSDICDVCSYLDEDLFEDLLETFAGNPSLSPAHQNQVLLNSYKSQGKQFAVLYALANNPNVSDEMKIATLDTTLLTDGIDSEDVLGDFLEAFRSNPRYTKDEIKAFIKTCNEEYDMPDGWSK